MKKLKYKTQAVLQGKSSYTLQNDWWGTLSLDMHFPHQLMYCGNKFIWIDQGRRTLRIEIFQTKE